MTEPPSSTTLAGGGNNERRRPANANSEEDLLWAATLEAWCHNILYTRRVYPRDSFTSLKFLGISHQCHANRHPGVVSYIRDAVAVAIPALRQGIANEICLAIQNGPDSTPIEKYCLSFDKNEKNNNPFGTTSIDIQELERESRQLILSVLAMEGKSPLPPRPHLTFQILLHVPEESNDCEELNQALLKGEWFCQRATLPSTTTTTNENTTFSSSSSSSSPSQHPPPPHLTPQVVPPRRSEERRRIIEDMRLSSGTVHFTLCVFDKEKTVNF